MEDLIFSEEEYLDRELGDIIDLSGLNEEDWDSIIDIIVGALDE